MPFACALHGTVIVLCFTDVFLVLEREYQYCQLRGQQPIWGDQLNCNRVGTLSIPSIYKVMRDATSVHHELTGEGACTYGPSMM